MVAIGDKRAHDVRRLTGMEQPLAAIVGNALEVIESLDVLEGHGPKDHGSSSPSSSGAEMLLLGKVASSLDDGRGAHRPSRSATARAEGRCLRTIVAGRRPCARSTTARSCRARRTRPTCCAKTSRLTSTPSTARPFGRRLDGCSAADARVAGRRGSRRARRPRGARPPRRQGCTPATRSLTFLHHADRPAFDEATGEDPRCAYRDRRSAPTRRPRSFLERHRRARVRPRECCRRREPRSFRPPDVRVRRGADDPAFAYALSENRRSGRRGASSPRARRCSSSSRLLVLKTSMGARVFGLQSQRLWSSRPRFCSPYSRPRRGASCVRQLGVDLSVSPLGTRPSASPRR